MNQDRPEKIDQDCNVCGSAIEVGSAWSRCSNRDCPTRDRDTDLSTDASDERIADYWENRARAAAKDGPTQQEVDEAVEQAYREYREAGGHDTAMAFSGAVDALLPLSSYAGWGELDMEVNY